jgi:hypothetical protein
MWNIFDIAVFCAGFAACWFGKDPITKLFLGTQIFAQKLEAKAKALRAAL